MNKKMFVIISALVFCVLTFTRSYARHLSEGTSTTPVGISLPVFIDSIGSIDMSLSEMKPGTIKTYYFHVTNENETSILSYVTLDYYLSIERSTNLPLDIKLTKDGGTTNILDGNLITPTYTMNHDERVFHNYTLTVEWNISNNDYQYANLTEYLTIKSHGEQKIN